MHVKAEGRESAAIDLQDYTDVVHVTPGAFDVLDVPILRGRDITWTDGAAGPPAVVVNEAFALRFFESEDPLGHLVRFRTVRHTEDIIATIVGVVPGLAIAGARGDFADAIYVPLTVSQPRDVHVLLRAAPGYDPRPLARELRGALATLDPDKPLHSIGTLRDLLRREQRIGYAFAGLFVGTGLAGLLMAGTGLYAVMAFAVSRRKREVGVRVALGASPARVVWATLRHAAVQLTQGVFLGLVLVIFAGPALEALSLREGSLLPASAVVTGVLLATGLLAAFVPSMRAVSIQPTEALKSE
jgi:putative ABC transport system permease protein